MPIPHRFKKFPRQAWLAQPRAWLARLREHFPLTTQGLITLTLVLLALQVFGFGRMDLVVFALGVCALAILGFVLLSVICGGLLLQFRVRARLRESGSDVASTVEAGYPNETGFSLPAYNLLPLIRLSWEVVYPDGIETRTPVSTDGDRLLEEILPHRRFRTVRLIRRFTVSDVLGFCRYSWRQGQAVNLQALPRSNTINALPLLRSLTAEDGIPSPSGNPEGDRMEIRPYVPGDSVRNIMWKVYARTGELNVRLPERSVFHSTRTVAYLIAGGNDEAAAAVARVAIETGALGDNWIFSADGTEKPCTDRQTALQAIAASRALDQEFAYGLDRFLATVAEHSGCHCIVFVAAEDGAWVEALKQTLSRFRGRFSVVLATDGFADDKPVPRWKRLVWMDFDTGATGRQRVQPPRTPRAGLIPLLTELGQLVESTLVVDRHTGSSFDGRLRRV